MWRGAGAGELYAYLPPFTDPRFAANKKPCDSGAAHCNPAYGTSFGRGSFSFAAGTRTTVAERVRLNDVGQANGELELFVGGRSVVRVDGLILRDSDAGRIRGIQMQTFFGGASYQVPLNRTNSTAGVTGSQPQWASPRDQNTYFSDFSLAITALL